MNSFCGTDIIEVKRIEDAIINTPNFLNKVYSKAEIDISLNKCDNIKYQYFAGRFAAKEAIYKALSNIFPELSMFNIEILNNKENSNRPIVNIKDDFLNKLILENKLKIDVSISHIEKYATANAIVTFLN